MSTATFGGAPILTSTANDETNMLSQIYLSNELGNTDWHVVSEDIVPVKAQQDDVDYSVYVLAVIEYKRKHDDADEEVQVTTAETETESVSSTLSSGSAEKDTSKRRLGRPKG